MAVENKPSPPAAITVPKEYPLDFPKVVEPKEAQPALDKWWTDTRTVLLRQSEIISDLANAIRDQQTGDLTAINSLISALTLRVQVLEFEDRGLIVDADVAQDASIREFKLALAYPTHSSANDPTANEKAAMVGTVGTPSAGNPFVTASDPRLGSGGVGTVPVGTIITSARPTILAGWLDCDGTAVSRTTYSSLFEALSIRFAGITTNASPNITGVTPSSQPDIVAGMPISGPNIPAGTTVVSYAAGTLVMSANATGDGNAGFRVCPWGVGDGSTTFDLPSLSRRALVGSGGSGTSTLANMLGATGGEETHLLTSAESGLPAHTHTGTSPLVDFDTGPHPVGSGAGSATPDNAAPLTIDANAAANASDAHNNVQPSAIVKMLIKY